MVESGYPRLGGVQVFLLVLAVVGCRLAAIQSCPIYDDAFITYRYAQNLAAGEGLVFNPGAPWEPVLGTTAPAYAVLLAALVKLGMHVVTASYAVNLLSDALAAVLISHLLSRSAWRTTIALIGFGALPQLARISAGGMESPVLLCAVLSGAAFAASRHPLAPLGAGTCAALACTLRPEGVLCVAALFLAHRRPMRRALLFLLPVLVIGIAYALALWSTYGSLIPQSVVAKSGLPRPLHFLDRPRTILRESFYPVTAMIAGLPFVLLGMWQSFARRDKTWPVGLFSLLLVGAYLIARPKTWGWYFYVPLTAWVIWFAQGSSTLGHSLQWLRRRGAQVPFLVAPLLILLANAYAIARRERVTALVYGEIALWAQSERVAERGARILASDIGAVAFYSGARVLDSEGLVWPQALDYRDKNAIVREHRPEYVFLVANRERIAPFRGDPELRSLYHPIQRFNTNGRHELEPSIERLPSGWVQDYLLYAREEVSR